MKIVVIGGNAAGMSAASRLARKNKDLEVIVLEKTDLVSYGSCGMPYYISGINDDLELLKIRSPEQFRKSGIDLRLKNEVLDVDIKKKSVLIHDIEKNTNYEQPYDKLIIGCGSQAIVPPIEGADFENVFSLKTLSDADAIKKALLKDTTRRVAVIGGGFIGMEVADAVVRQGKKVLLFEALPHVMNVYDEPFQLALEKTLRDNDVDLHLSEQVSKIEGESGKAQRIVTEKDTYDVDIVLFAIGVRPNTKIFSEYVFKKLRNGALVVNESMETTVPDVYAAGDCATVVNAITKEVEYIALATTANKQGRLVADAILGQDVKLNRTLGTSMLRVLDLELGKTGLSEKQAQELNLDYGTATVQALSHASYYKEPSPYELTAKIVYDNKTKVILGAQIMGEREAAMRINIFACAIDRKMTTEELGFLDLAYLPSHTQVWDIVQIVGNVAK